MKPVVLNDEPGPDELVITLNNVRLTEFIAGFVQCSSEVMEVNPTLSLLLSHEMTAPFIDARTPEGTPKIRHMIRLPWRRSELVFGLSDQPFRFPLRTTKMPAGTCLHFVLEVDTVTAMGQPGTKMVGVGSVPIQRLQEGKACKVNIINRPAVAAGYSDDFNLKGVLHLDKVIVEIPSNVHYVHNNKAAGSEDEMRVICDKITDRYYEVVNNCEPLQKDLACVHTPFYASGTVPCKPKRQQDVPMIPSSLGFDRRPPAEYQFEPHFIDTLLTASLDQCNLTEKQFLAPSSSSSKEWAKAVECAHLVVTLLPICERYGFDESYDFNRDLGTASAPWDPHQERVDQDEPRYSLLAPASRLVPRHNGPLRIDAKKGYLYTHQGKREEAEVEDFEAWSKPYVVPSARRRNYGRMDTAMFGGTDELNVPMMGGESIMDCEDGAFYARKLIESMTHVIQRAENAEQRARFEALKNIYDHYIYARTVNWCHGDVCHILTVGFEKHDFYEGVLRGIEVSLAVPSVCGESTDELKRLRANVTKQLSKTKQPDSFAYPRMVALETTSKAAMRLDGVPAAAKRDALIKLGIKLDVILKDSPNIRSQWQFTMQTCDLEEQDSMVRFLKWPNRNPLYDFYNYITTVEVAHDEAFQSEDVAWMSFLASENFGQDPKHYLTHDSGKPIYGAHVQCMALNGYTLLPAMCVSRKQREAVEELMRADLPIAFFTGRISEGIDVVVKQPKHDLFIPISIEGSGDADTRLRQDMKNKLLTDISVVENMVPLRFYVEEELFSSDHLAEFERGLERLSPSFYGLDYDIISLACNVESAIDAVEGKMVSKGLSSLSYTKSHTRIYCISVYFSDIVKNG